MKLFKKFKNTIESIRLCIRYPFLKPDAGAFAAPYKLREHGCNIYKKYTIFKKEPRFEVEWTSQWQKLRYTLIQCVIKMYNIKYIIPTWTKLDWMPSGWRNAFGLRLCEDLRRELLRAGGRRALRRYHIYDIKEKWGALRWDDGGIVGDVSKIVAMYEYLSQRYCICCGALATCITPPEYWESPYCDAHFPENCSCKLEYGTDQLPWYGWVGNIHSRPEGQWKHAQETAKEYFEPVKEDDDNPVSGEEFDLWDTSIKRD